MQNHDDRRGQGWQDQPRRGQGPEEDEARTSGGGSAEGRSWEPPYDDERTYGRQGQRGGSRFSEDQQPGRYPRGGGTYGQGGDTAATAQRSPYREGYRYQDSGEAGQPDIEPSRERGAGGQGGYSGYGSSGKGDYGPGGFPRGGYGSSGYGRDYGQGGRGAEQSGAPIGSYEAYSGGGDTDDRAGQGQDFDPDYMEWRRSQLASYDRDYNHWREQQARSHDDEYRSWRDERRKRFHDDFHGWRQSRSSGSGMAQTPISPSTSGGLAGIAHAGRGGADRGLRHPRS